MSDLLCPKLTELLYKNPQISPSNPNQNTEQHCGFDQQTSEHSRNDIHPREACTVNQLLEEGGDEDANCSSERKEQHPPRRNLMLARMRAMVIIAQMSPPMPRCAHLSSPQPDKRPLKNSSILAIVQTIFSKNIKE